ncbi:hypothetical protein [Myxococcus landrumensis]|uniref:Uncharacterized protein n=1 Tax=Myxococcus landrumensis TaxID=2813577 RepID=A0ABX7N0A8_9BACT|nr:hypothetical protein [Myxococcus landrumus]QSQ12131.1 hypothetical protein JY572_27670 [Myxococcus landrumus]
MTTDNRKPLTEAGHGVAESSPRPQEGIPSHPKPETKKGPGRQGAFPQQPGKRPSRPSPQMRPARRNTFRGR